jgi:hypothetical protein
MEMPVQQLVSGRRIYIHEHSFTILAATGPDERTAVASLLAESWIFRIALHHISSNQLIGALTTREEEVATEALRARYRAVSTPILAAILFKAPGRRPTPLIDKDERVHATCFDSGYYTFATDQASACRMYADAVPLRHLYSAYSQGAGEPDLTMGRGRCLAWSGTVSTATPDEMSLPAASTVAAELVDRAVAAGRRQADRRLIELWS